MADARVQELDDDITLEVTETVVSKRTFSRNALLREKAYFEELVLKGQEGVARADGRLAQIEDEITKSKLK